MTDEDRQEPRTAGWCPTCTGPVRETTGLVCGTCCTDYGSDEVCDGCKGRDHCARPDGLMWGCACMACPKGDPPRPRERTAGQLTADDLGREVTVTCRVVAVADADGWGPTVEFAPAVPAALATIGKPQYVTLNADTAVHVHDDREPEVCGACIDGVHGHCEGRTVRCKCTCAQAWKGNREPDGEEVRRG